MTGITIRQLVKRFGKTTAVDAVDLDVPPGALFFLLGPSGCGKTTLLRMIAGFTDPTSGIIRFGDKDVSHTPPNKRNCGMVFQSYALWPHMTVRQNVAFGLNVRKVSAGETTRRVDKALDDVQMLRYADRKPNELSGGQQQRVALARALVIEPTVLLLDEPLSNLDAKLRLEMRSQIRAICKAAKITGVYVTHDQKEALSMADQMAVLRDGKVIQTGEPRAMYDRPGSRFVADFLGETNFIDATVAGTEGATIVLDTVAGRFRSTTFPADIKAGDKVTCSIRPEAVRVTSAEKASPAPDGTGLANVIDAYHAETVYLGETAQHQVLAPGEMRIKAFELNPRLTLNGAPCRLAIDARDVVVLKA